MDSAHLSFAALLSGALARWRTALAVAAGAVLLAAALALILPPSYRATSSFVTADADSRLGAGGGLAQLATEGDIAGVASQLGLGTARDPSESPAFYGQLLASRELLTRLLQSRVPDPRGGPTDSATLLSVVRPRDHASPRALEAAIKRLKRSMRVNFDLKTSLVVLNVDARWSSLAAEIANRAVALVSEFNREQRLSRARARRDFLEHRVAAAQAELRAEEDSQRLFYERNRSWENSAALMVEERRSRRQVETANSLYLTLRQQYEAARIDEVNNTPVITVVDRAVAPQRPEWPHLGLILASASVLGVALGGLAAAGRELASHWARHNPEQVALLRSTLARVSREIAGALPGRRRDGARPARAA